MLGGEDFGALFAAFKCRFSSLLTQGGAAKDLCGSSTTMALAPGHQGRADRCGLARGRRHPREPESNAL